jgi:eukaryotic-like serine/threonine-protein kinase
VQNGNGNGTGTVKFGPFEADLHAGEVRKAGSRIKLQDQPFKVLQVLLERPGDLVTREELQSRIWPRETFGDFDHAVNVAVGKLRTALGDSAENPSFIETIPRRGYRFVAKLEAPLPPIVPPAPERPELAPVIIAIAALAIGVGAFLGYYAHRTQAPDFQRLTAQRGTIYSARFAPDGRNVVYAAAWNGEPIGIFSTDIKLPGARNLGLPATDLLAVSSSGQLAVLQPLERRFLMTVRGTLGQLPMTGGAPRPIAENVEGADWAPDGKTLAIVRSVGGLEQLEFPVGHVLYRTPGWISHARVSPKGNRIAFLDHLAAPDDRGVVAVVDLAGHTTILSRGWETEQGLAWTPDGSEVWFSATRSGMEHRIYAVDLSGHERLVYRAPGGVTVQDIAPNGDVLLTRDESRAGMFALASGATSERDLTWLDWSLPMAISADGRMVLFTEEGEQAGPNYTTAIRDVQGSPPIALGEGLGGDFSPDGKWVSAVISSTQLVLMPTGAGATRHVDRGPIQQYWHAGHWTPDGKALVFPANLPGQAMRCFIQNVDGGAPRPVTPEGVTTCTPSPDGQLIAGNDSIYPLGGGAARAIAGVLPGESLAWTSDPHFMYAYRSTPPPLTVYRLNVTTGLRQPVTELKPADPTGLGPVSHVLFSADGRAYVYSYHRFLSELYVATHLH